MEETYRRRVCAGRGRKEDTVFFVLSQLALCVLVCVASGYPARAAESGEPKNVLVLYSFSSRDNSDQLDSLKAAIRLRVHSPVNFYVNNLESQGFEDLGFEKSLSESLSHEYRDVKIDLIIASAYPALRFAVTHRDEIFPGVPVLFSHVYGDRLAGKQLWPGVTGVTISVGVRDTLDLLYRLHPDTQNIAVVTGTSEFERYWLAAVRTEFRPYAGKVKLIEIVGSRNDELLKQVDELPAHTEVLFQLAPRESRQPEIGLSDLIAAVTERFPTYCIFRVSCIDHGGIGGSYADNAEQNLKTSEIAARILSGEKPENIPVAHGSAGRFYVDWRQLRRWNIPESALPPGTIVLYRQPTVWKRYGKYILAGVAVIVLQAFLIAGLLWQRARRRAVAEALERLGGRLIHTQEEERGRIARELHDDFSQRLAVQCVELTQLRKNLPESEIEERARALNMLKETKEISADMRLLSHQLHSSRLKLVGLVPALSGLCEEVAKKYRIDVQFIEPESPPNLTKDVGLCLFRVAQEALGNVAKHSEAKTAHVELDVTANIVSLRISDAGKGFSADMNKAGEGIGLISMRERLRLVRGKLSVRSEPMQGTEILAEVPLVVSSNEAQASAHAARGIES